MKASRRLLLLSLLVGAGAWAVYWIADEMQTSRLQASVLSRFARELQFDVEPGPSSAIRFPGSGPYDERLGYRQLPTFIEQLVAQDFEVTAQARMSARLIELNDRGLYAIYHEKNQAGFELSDCRGDPLHAVRFPQRVYENFESVPPVLADTLLFIENRELLDPRHATRNPAIEWDRLANAAIGRTLRLADIGYPASGGSTLATQIEKYRHSPEGRTDSVKEKLHQMASASLRGYLDGEDTLGRRRQIAVDYLNTVPLSAQAGFGEVNGLGDGLWAWYGRDFAEVNRLLAHVGDIASAPPGLLQRRALAFKQALIPQQAMAFKQALSLMVAQRRPSYYLGDGEPSLAQLTNSYLRIMAEAGVITPALRDAALPIPVNLLPHAPAQQAASVIERKATTAMRSKLSALLGVPRLYDLDRLDLAVTSSLDGGLQRAATQFLRGLKEPAAAKAAGLYGFHLLKDGDDPDKLVFSFTLFERSEHANLLRVQTDNNDQPFDVNEGAKLDLGSTAKLRTLITYLEVVADLHSQWSSLTAEELAAVAVHKQDALGRWAREYLSRSRDRGLTPMLEAAMKRTYSASPAETFFTGGGAHRFENFEPEDNVRVISVREALARSVNLVFIRLMRDVVHHYMFRTPGSSAALLEDQTDPGRRDYLARFADKEGREFIVRFYKKYHGKSRQEAEELLLQSVKASPAALASAFLGLEPEAGVERLAEFLRQHLDDAGLSEPALRALHDRHGEARLSLPDRGYVAGVHPLELWLVGYLRHQPDATLSAAIAASRHERQEVYAWLFKTHSKDAQDVRIRSLLELEAFMEIQRAWHRLGYPFESLTPSYATAIGASGDRPAALAELMGIIVNQGLRLPVVKIGTLAFARDTPYETRLSYRPPPPERVMSTEIAQTVHRSLVGVVENGTARRLNGALMGSDGRAFEVGGKTGTGDHRFDVHGKGGQLISSRIVDRTATFVFLIGDRYFGTVMVYVHEPYAEKYKFTSALPTQVLKSLAPLLLPTLGLGPCGSGSAVHPDLPSNAPGIRNVSSVKPPSKSNAPHLN